MAKNGLLHENSRVILQYRGGDTRDIAVQTDNGDKTLACGSTLAWHNVVYYNG
jgi:hypothetical protein